MHNVTDYVANRTLRRSVTFRKIHGVAAPWFLRKKVYLVTVPPVEDRTSQPIPWNSSSVLRHLLRVAAAPLAHYHIKGKKMTLKFGHLSLVGFPLVPRQKEQRRTDLPRPPQQSVSYSGCPATAAKNLWLRQCPSISASAQHAVPSAAPRPPGGARPRAP